MTKLNSKTQFIVGGKKFSAAYLGIKDSDFVAIKKNNLGAARLMKSKDLIHWEVVDCPENYGFPSIQIIQP